MLWIRVFGTVLAGCAFLCARPSLADDVHVALASNFAGAFRVISKDFEHETGHRLLVSRGSTGKLYAQIQNGAPFEVFLAADTEHPRLLEVEGLAVAGTRFTYAVGRLVLWSAEAHRFREGGPVALRAGDFRHLALANPKTAPYGRAAVQALQALGVWEALRTKLVYGENVGQAFQFVASGNAELGLVAFAQTLDPRFQNEASSWKIPAGLHEPLHQDAVLLTKGRDHPAPTALLDFLRSPQAWATIERMGYERAPS